MKLVMLVNSALFTGAMCGVRSGSLSAYCWCLGGMFAVAGVWLLWSAREVDDAEVTP